MKLFNFLKDITIRKKAIAYYRHSAEDKQENSVPIQKDHIRKFATTNNIEIIHEEADEGETGLLANRPGFQRLFNNWINNPNAPPFDYVLVYDVSRWGRFQKLDESGYFSHLCTKAGKELIYVSKGFIDEQYKDMADMMIFMERKMAADYSKQLSEKVFHGCVKVIQQGYSAGGSAPYGYTRLLLDENKKPLHTLKKGDHKAIANQRVTFTPSNDRTTGVVKEIFSLFTKDNYEIEEIALELNNKKIPSPGGRKWSGQKILHILTNQTYLGTRVYNKTWNRLKKGKRDNAVKEWIFCYNAFEPIVSKDDFNKAQEKLNQYYSGQKNKIDIIKKMRRYFNHSLEKFLIEKGFSEDDLFPIRKKFPVCFSVFSSSSWCFTVTENMKRYSSILCFGISPERENFTNKIFMVPSEEFNLGGFRIMQELEKEPDKYLVKEENMEKELFSLVNELKGGNLVCNNVN